MAKNPSAWSPKRLVSWFISGRDSRKQNEYRRMRAKRISPFESLEDRELLAVVVTLDTTNIQPDVPAIVIQGSGFDPIVSNVIVTFNDGAVGTVIAATETELTVEFATPPTAAGILTAIVTTTTENSGAAVQVATVIPKVTSSTANLAADANTITINGSGFSTTAANNTVVFNNDAVGTVTAATTQSLTVSLSTRPTTAGSLTAQVTTNGVSSASAVQVAKVIPVVTSSSSNLNAGAATLTINGYGFDPTAANNTVDFDGDAVGTVTAATATSLTITFSTSPTVAGDLYSIVTTNSISCAGSVKVATVVPVITSSAANLAANASTIAISGFGFGSTAGSNTVVFNNGAAGTVTSATSTTLNVTFTTKPTRAGSLTATVTTNSVPSAAAIQVATVIPVITSRTVRVPAPMKQLNETHSRLGQAPRKETIVAERFLARLGPVKLMNVVRLGLDVHYAGHRHLHAKRHFVLRNASDGFRVTGFLVGFFIEILQGIQGQPPNIAGHACWVLHIKDGASHATALHTLVNAGQEPATPQCLARARRTTSGKQHNVTWQIGVLRPKSPRDPRTLRWISKPWKTGVNNELGRRVVELVRRHRFHEANVVNHLGKLRQTIRDPGPALPVLLEGELRAQQLGSTLNERKALSGQILLRTIQTIQLLQFRFVIEQLELARGSGHVQENDALRLRRKLRWQGV